MAPPSPYDDPVPRGWKFVQGVLRVAVCLQCAGLAAAHLYAGQPSAAAGLLNGLAALPDVEAGRLVSLVGYGLAAAAVLTLLRPSWPVLLCVVLWFAAEAAAPLVDGADVPSLLRCSVHVLMPLGLLLIDFWPPRLAFSIGRAKVAMAMLRLAVVVSTSAQGLMTLAEIPAGGTQGELLRSAAVAVGRGPSESQLAQALALIVAADLALACHLLLSRNRIVAGALAAWLVAKAALWIAGDGAAASAPFLLEASQAGAPLAVLLFWVCAVKEQPPLIVPGSA